MAPAESERPVEAEVDNSETQAEAPPPEPLGQRIRSRRHAQKLSLNDLARMSGVSKGYLSQVERSLTSRPSAATVFSIADALGMSVTELFDGIRPDGEEDVSPEVEPSLQEFVDEADLPPVDITMLAGIRYRGLQPSTKDDWRYLYESIRRSVDASRKTT